MFLGAGSGAYYKFVYFPAHHVPEEDAYVLAKELEVLDTPAEVHLTVARLKYGDRVGVITRTRNWTQMRLRNGRTGWAENTGLLDAATYERGQNLRKEMLGLPAQAEGHLNAVSNLRLEPSRDAPLLGQLDEKQRVEVFGRRVVARPANPEQGSSATVMEVWYLVRAGNHAGWVLGRFVALDIPEGLAPYAQSANLVAWVVLDTVDDGGQQVPQYIVADRIGTQDLDFNHIRVFTWWVKNHHYVTAFVEGGLQGYFPIRVMPVNGITYFHLRLMDEQGHKFQKVYGLFDTITRLVGVVDGWESNAMPATPLPRRKRRR